MQLKGDDTWKFLIQLLWPSQKDAGAHLLCYVSCAILLGEQ